MAEERDEAREDARPEEGPHKLDQLDELERQRSPYRDWVAPEEEQPGEGEWATRDPRTPPARLEPLSGEDAEEDEGSE